MPRPKQRTPELRAQVLENAMGLLADEGVGAFTARRVAERSQTSTPAVYELFGDKQGLVREIYLEGFRRLGERFESVPPSGDAKRDIHALIQTFRAFAVENPVITEVMFAQPFTDFRPEGDELAVLQSVNRLIVKAIRRGIEAGVLSGDPVDVAHALMSSAQGLAAAENASRLGSTQASVDRRWELTIDSLLRGLGGDGAGKLDWPG